MRKLTEMNADELMAFWNKYRRPSRKDAEELIGDRRPLYTNYASRVAALACAMACVKEGSEVYREHCRIYLELLPVDVKERLNLTAGIV